MTDIATLPTITSARIARYAERLNDGRLTAEVLDWVRSLPGNFSPATVASIAYEEARQPRLARLYVTRYLADPNEELGETPGEATEAVETLELVLRSELPEWFLPISREDGTPRALSE